MVKNENNHFLIVGITVLLLCVGLSGCQDLDFLNISGIEVHSWEIVEYDNYRGSNTNLAVDVRINRENGAYFFLMLPNGTSYSYPKLVREGESTTIYLPLGSRYDTTFQSGEYTIIAFDKDYMYKSNPEPVFTKEIIFKGAELSFLDWTIDKWDFNIYPGYLGYYIQNLTLRIKNTGDLPTSPTVKVQLLGKDDVIDTYRFILPNKEINLTVSPKIYEIPCGKHATTVELQYDNTKIPLTKNIITYKPRLSIRGFSPKWRYWESSYDYDLYSVTMLVANDGAVPFYFGDSDITVGNTFGIVSSFKPYVLDPGEELQISAEVEGIHHVSDNGHDINIALADSAGNIAQNYNAISYPEEYIIFTLNSWEITSTETYYGFKKWSINLNAQFDVNTEATIKLLNPDKNQVSLAAISPNDTSKSLNLATGTTTPPGGEYILEIGEYVYASDGDYVFRVASREYIYIHDPYLSATIEPIWTKYDSNHYYLSGCDVTFHNTGNLPAFVKYYTITIDDRSNTEYFITPKIIDTGTTTDIEFSHRGPALVSGSYKLILSFSGFTFTSIVTTPT